MSRSTRSRLLATLVAFSVVFATTTSVADAGGPPRLNDFELDLAYLGCVDDEVDEPGVDGRALVRLRLTNVGLSDVTVDGGGWRLVIGSDTVAEDTLPGPSPLPVDGTWETVVQIPGGTGPAQFAATVDVSNELGTSTFGFDLLDVPGDCPQPDDTTTTVGTSAAADVTRVAPRLTG